VNDTASTAARPSLKGEVEVAEPTRFERSVGRRSAEIRATVPHVEFTRAVVIDSALGAAQAAGVPLAALLLAATAQALRAVPRLNGAYRDGRLERYSRVNIGVTFAADGLYVIPTVFDSDTKSLEVLAAELADLRARAGEDRLDASELTGATFSLTDLGEHGVHSGAPLVVGGHGAALSAGAPRAVPVVRDGTVGAGHELILSLAVDHRLAQVPDAGRFLAAVAERLEGP
jgi:pyruvate dehydrogenase E2 component (dihydrolipoamide acetyltransferase)